MWWKNLFTNYYKIPDCTLWFFPSLKFCSLGIFKSRWFIYKNITSYFQEINHRYQKKIIRVKNSILNKSSFFFKYCKEDTFKIHTQNILILISD